MNLLFFDIECANCFQGNGKICSFGWTLCNDSFQVISQVDLLINPKSKFHLSDKSGLNGIQLSYPQERFLSQPDFEYFYPQIKKMLEDTDNVCWGHSVVNDINFINSECRRYNLPYINFKAYDSQMIHRLITQSPTDVGLSKICGMYNLQVTDLHRSDYDAYLTSRIVEKMCEQAQASISQLLSEYPNAFYETKDGVVTNHNVTISPSKKLLDFAKKLRPYDNLINDKINGKTFCFNYNFELKNMKKSMFLVKNLRLQGGMYSNKIAKSDYFLNSCPDCDRAKFISEASVSIEQITEVQMCDMLGVSLKEYNDSELMSFTRLKSLKLIHRN